MTIKSKHKAHSMKRPRKKFIINKMILSLMEISPSMCVLSGRPLTRLKIDINISRHIGRDYSQTPAPICSH